MDDSQTAHVAILPSLGKGHLIPLIELASRLALCHGLSSTLLVDHSDRLDPLLRSLPPSITPHPLPPVDLLDLPPSSKMETRICTTVVRSLPAIRSILSHLKRSRNLVAFVVDLFGADGLDVARELGVSSYIFFPSTATTLTLFLHLPTLDSKVAVEYRDHPDPICLPGCVPLQGRDLLTPTQDRGDDAYRWLLHQCKKYYDAEGILVNSFDGVEPGPCRFLREPVPGRPRVYPVGPLIRTSGHTEPHNDPTGCLEWLGRQPVGSVLFVSFGSGGVLSWEQMTELAAGLEMSRQRFLWVVRPPSEGSADADFFGFRGQEDPLRLLPDGFLERTKGVGLMVPNWAPQEQILGSQSTGGFLSHCGWNSTLESVAHGVPMIAWPLYAEQRMNAVALVDEVKVALRAEEGGTGVVGREEVSRVVRALMEGEEGKELRRRAKRVEEAARAALAEGGASCTALTEVVRRWKSIAS